MSPHNPYIYARIYKAYYAKAILIIKHLRRNEFWILEETPPADTQRNPKNGRKVLGILKP